MKNKTITLIIPLFNEGKRVHRTIEGLLSGFKYPGITLEEIIFTDDGSTDKTIKLLRQAKPLLEKKLKAKVTILTSSQNHGRGYAVRKAALKSNSDYALYVDADFSIPFANIRNCLTYIKKNNDLIFGSKKKMGASAVRDRGLVRNIVGYGHSLIASAILGVWAWDFQGGFKLFSKSLIEEVFPLMTIDRWGFDMEIIFLAKKLGYKTEEVPVLWSHVETDSKVKLSRDILRSLREMVLIKLAWRRGFYRQEMIARAPRILFKKA